jgi:hypothetical protein
MRDATWPNGLGQIKKIVLTMVVRVTSSGQHPASGADPESADRYTHVVISEQARKADLPSVERRKAKA